MQRSVLLGFVLLTACGGGGGGAAPLAMTNASPAATPASSATPQLNTVAGTLVSTDSDPPVPVAGATVVVGPILIAGATIPPQLPAGDVAVTTGANGTFSAVISAPPVAPVSEPFVIPSGNVLGIAAPAAGYYIGVFAGGTDGVSAGALLPLHAFAVSGAGTTLRVSTATAAEAGALAAINRDRAANGAAPLIFDATAEAVARTHAADEARNGYTCHYDVHNAGPASRYVAAGGLGLTGENLALVSGSAASAFAIAESAFLSEGSASPPGGHFRNLVDTAHLWAGVAAVPVAAAPAFADVDYELVTPSAVDAVAGVSGYPLDASCPPGTTVNGS